MAANSLIKKMEKYETVLMTIIWDKILKLINATSKSTECTLFKGSILLQSLENFIKQFRNEFCSVKKKLLI